MEPIEAEQGSATRNDGVMAPMSAAQVHSDVLSLFDEAWPASVRLEGLKPASTSGSPCRLLDGA